MLEPHPPHTTPHTWRDFFIHIATIVVGLLIAVGLEQTVEALHRRHQRAELREALHFEHRQNIALYKLRTDEFHREAGALEDNLASLLMLQQHPGTPAAALPHPLNWYIYLQAFNNAAWVTAQQSTQYNLLAQDELRSTAAVYFWIERAKAVDLTFADAMYNARRYTFQDPDPAHLTPAQVTAEIELCKAALQQLYLLGNTMNNLALEAPEFRNGPTPLELVNLMHDPHPQEAVRLIERRAMLHHQADALELSSESPAAVSH